MNMGAVLSACCKLPSEALSRSSAGVPCNSIRKPKSACWGALQTPHAVSGPTSAALTPASRR